MLCVSWISLFICLINITEALLSTQQCSEFFWTQRGAILGTFTDKRMPHFPSRLETPQAQDYTSAFHASLNHQDQLGWENLPLCKL